MSAKPTIYRGFTITQQRGGYTVSKGGHVETSQPSMAFAQSWVDQNVREQPADAPDRIALQNEEFTAARELAKALDIHDKVAVVDDDYPEVRHKYESRVKDLIDAFRKNGRIL